MKRLWNRIRPDFYLVVSGLSLTAIALIAAYKLGWI